MKKQFNKEKLTGDFTLSTRYSRCGRLNYKNIVKSEYSLSNLILSKRDYERVILFSKETGIYFNFVNTKNGTSARIYGVKGERSWMKNSEKRLFVDFMKKLK